MDEEENEEEEEEVAAATLLRGRGWPKTLVAKTLCAMGAQAKGQSVFE